jgi:dihydroorotase
MKADLVVKNGVLVTPEATLKAGVAITGGKIVAVARDEDLPEGKEVIDVKGNYILPGLIDGHVHFRDPGLTYKEDFETGSMAAACGGITCVIDMPNTKPICGDVASFKEKKEIAESKSWVDFGLIGVIIGENIPQIVPMADAGVVGFKIFMGETVGAIPAPDDGAILEALGYVAKAKRRVGVHAENNQIMQHLIKKLKAAGRTDPLAHVEARPNIAEAESISKIILLAEATGAKVHIYHMSSKEGVDLVKTGKERGIDVTAETGPHYLLMEDKDMLKLKSILKMNPPVRSKDNADRLWWGLLNGYVDCIATDHSPHTVEEKTNDNIWDAIPGFTGVESSVPLMLTQVNAGKLTLNQYVKLASENPAKVWNMYPQKGSVRIGSDGDLTIVDMKKEGVIKSENLHSKTKVTPFNGWKVKGMPIYTIVRGKVVMKDGQLVGTHSGRIVIPAK